MMSSPHGPYVQGYTRATMASTKRLYTPPVTPSELVLPEVVSLTARGAAPKVGLMMRVKS